MNSFNTVGYAGHFDQQQQNNSNNKSFATNGPRNGTYGGNYFGG